MESIVISRYHVWIGIIVIVVVRVSRLLKRIVRGGTAVRWYRIVISERWLQGDQKVPLIVVLLQVLTESDSHSSGEGC